MGCRLVAVIPAVTFGCRCFGGGLEPENEIRPAVPHRAGELPIPRAISAHASLREKALAQSEQYRRLLWRQQLNFYRGGVRPLARVLHSSPPNSSYVRARVAEHEHFHRLERA